MGIGFLEMLGARLSLRLGDGDAVPVGLCDGRAERGQSAWGSTTITMNLDPSSPEFHPRFWSILLTSGNGLEARLRRTLRNLTQKLETCHCVQMWPVL